MTGAHLEGWSLPVEWPGRTPLRDRQKERSTMAPATIALSPSAWI